MAHPLRMRVLCKLAQGESSVGELIEFSGAPQPTVSQVVLKMKAEGLLAARRDGRFIHYKILDPRVGKLVRSLKKIFCEENET
ncbi:MAG: transcriptional regulator [Proteobacteria bacterium]|nr:transcriptional regulator [Pseudomonadota bacterium]